MTKRDWQRLAYLPADIAARAERIRRAEALQADGPAIVSDTVQSSTDAGDATINRHATVRGRDASFDAREQRITGMTAMLHRMQEQYAHDYAEACEAIEAEDDPEMRVLLHAVLLDGKRYADYERRSFGEVSEDAARMRVTRWVEKQLQKKKV